MRPAFYVLLGVLLVPTVGLVGDVVTDGKFTSTMPTGAPLAVASDDMVANLNADMVDGVEGTDLYTKAEVDALVATAVEVAGPRSFYLTDASYAGGAALAACGAGFHMASVWELSDPSNLKYAYDDPDALTYGDSAHGPPSDALGWIRTGYVGSSSDTPGKGNCSAWTSVSPSDRGTVVMFSATWNDPALGGTFVLVWGAPWAASAWTCSTLIPVWCVED